MAQFSSRQEYCCWVGSIVSSKKRVLFVTWDGPSATYLESLFLPIFSGLRQYGFEFSVLQFSWAAPEHVDIQRARCADFGISYFHELVWRWPRGSGPLISACLGAKKVNRAAYSCAADILMPRSIMPAVAVLVARNRSDLPIVFDADGLMADERVDFGGLSSSSYVYRLLRDAESQMVRRSVLTLVRTPQAAEILLSRAGAGTDAKKFAIVSNGRDEAIFKPSDEANRVAMRTQLGVPSTAPLIVYSGSLGSQYCLPEMLEFFKYVLLRRQDAHFLLLTNDPAAAFKFISHQPPHIAAQILVKSVSPSEVALHLSVCDLGLAFRRPSFSTSAVRPIKMAEYLLSGLPVAGTSAPYGAAEIFKLQGGGDVGQMACEEMIHVANWFTSIRTDQSARVRQRVREEGMRNWSLAGAVESYRSALDGVSWPQPNAEIERRASS